MDGFYPPLPKIFVVKGSDIVDTRTGKVVDTALNGKDARYVCELKNVACQQHFFYVGCVCGLAAYTYLLGVLFNGIMFIDRKGIDKSQYKVKIMNELKTVIYYNENGNAKAGVRKAIKEQGIEMLVGELENIDLDVIQNARGGISIPVATDEKTNDIVYIEIDLKVNVLHPDTEKKKAKGKSKKSGTTVKDADGTITFYAKKD